MNRLRATSGFSLTELLISVIIISIGIVGFATAVGLMATELWFGRRDTEISMLVSDQIEELKAGGAASVTPGSLVEGNYRLDWTIQATNPVTTVIMVATYYGNNGVQRADTILTYIPG